MLRRALCYHVYGALEAGPCVGLKFQFPRRSFRCTHESPCQRVEWPTRLTVYACRRPVKAPDDHIPLFAALGFAGSAWARMEQQLDMILIHINKEQHSAQLYQPEYPIAFERKIKLPKRWFNQHPPLKQYRDDMRLFTSKVKEIAPIRNHLLHSILQDWNPKEQVATMQTIKFEGDDTFRVRSRAVRLKTLKTFGTVANNANKFLSHVTFKILTDAALRI
jgi:hypothetical protein